MRTILPKSASVLLSRRSLLCAPAVFAFTSKSKADVYPSRQVSLVVPYAAGGTADILARLIAEEFHGRFQKSFIVENKGGAGGTIGCGVVANAPRDGHTLLFTAGGPLTIGPNLSKTPTYNVTTDFTPISLICQVPSFLVVNPASPAKTVEDLIALGREKPNALRFASAGIGTSVHMVAELFRLQAGFLPVHVPYRGGAPAMNDLLGGQVDFLFENVPQLNPFVSAGSLRALAVTSASRIETAPSVPTMSEAGVPGLEVGTWFGLLGPGGLPSGIVDLLVRTTSEIMGNASFKKRLVDLGANPDFRGDAAFAKFISEDNARWRDTIARANIERQ